VKKRVEAGGLNEENRISVGSEDVRVRDVQMPPDTHKRFREAYVLSSDRRAVVVDMTRAKELAREWLRREAMPAMNRLRDVIEERQDAGQSVANQVTKRKAIRAALNDPRIDAAVTPDALLDAVRAIRNEIGT